MIVPGPICAEIRRHTRMRTWALSLLTVSLLLGGCGDPGTGPGEVHWDHATCERCRMVVSDRAYAAQIRSFRPNGEYRLDYFDDIGCALIWLDRKPWREDLRTEFWVADWRTGAWIDARTASYVTGKETPMGYGLGAQAAPAPGALDFAAARRHIYEAEERFNAPLGQ